MLFIPKKGEAKETKELDIVIIGSGPAGLTAGIYAARSGLTGIILEKGVGGGLAAEAPFVENYTGFFGLKGEELARKMKEHASQYMPILEMSPVTKVEKLEDRKYFVESDQGNFIAQAVIFATGTTHKHLNVKGEQEFYGKGISYCVTCDGYFFKDRRVVVIGGGNSGAAAALVLADIVKEVTILEFMPRFMCENFYVKKLQERGIKYITNAQVTEIFGDEVARGVKYIDRATGEEKIIETDGIFIYVGLIPQSELAKNLGCELDQRGYIKVDNRMRTNIPRVYAAGDVTGGVAQIIVAAAQGAIAALSAYEDLRLK
ncbi:MAG: NAD(P)/FAD-dependent oxidoreductase [Candidatus Hydrothermia bacterium]